MFEKREWFEERMDFFKSNISFCLTSGKTNLFSKWQTVVGGGEVPMQSFDRISCLPEERMGRSHETNQSLRQSEKKGRMVSTEQCAIQNARMIYHLSVYMRAPSENSSLESISHIKLLPSTMWVFPLLSFLTFYVCNALSLRFPLFLSLAVLSVLVSCS